MLVATLHDSQKMETTQMSTNLRMDKQIQYPYDGVSSHHKKEWSTDPYYHVKEASHALPPSVGFHLHEMPRRGNSAGRNRSEVARD